MSRRRLLQALALAPFLVGSLRAEPLSELERFMALSCELTGWERLDPELGAAYCEALMDWEPSWRERLRQPTRSADLPAAWAEQLIAAWYTGTVPTPTGSRVVTYRGALAWSCLARSTPVSYCR